MEHVKTVRLMAILALYLVSAGKLQAQVDATPVPRDTLVAAARGIMISARYCALVTLDEAGQPRVRTMDPFSPDDDMVVWFGTHRRSRKVEDIRRDPRVTIYYLAPGATGYVSITGIARLVDDPRETASRWKDEWQAFYTDREADYILIEVTPVRLEVVDYTRGIVGDSTNWRAPWVDFGR